MVVGGGHMTTTSIVKILEDIMKNAVARKTGSDFGLEVMKTDSFTALVWNSCNACSGRNCKSFDFCDFGKDGGGSKCIPQKQYLESIYSAALDMLGVSISTREAVRLGLHLIPMYAILFQLKIAASGVDSVWETYGKYNDLRINPIYKEIREHVKTIDALWSSLGYKQLVGHGSSIDGDASYCDNMYGE